LSDVNLLGKKENTTSNSAPGFDSVGQILKYYRELKGLSLEEVSKRTYIKLKYLNSLEENLQDLMPAPVYVYSYIKHYAKLLGLEGGDLVKLYQKQCNLNEEEENTSPKVTVSENDFELRKPQVNDNIPLQRQKNNVRSQTISNNYDILAQKNDNIYYQNKNIIELNSDLQSMKNINGVPSGKDNGKTSMDLDSILNENNAPVGKPVKTEPKPVTPAIQQELPVTPKPEMSKPDDRIITGELINSTLEADRIIREARKEAERIIQDAQEEAYQLRHGAQTYADGVLKSLEQELSLSLSEIRNGRIFLMNKNL
jgi:transcriptional regulator with XRE-family HTH domain